MDNGTLAVRAALAQKRLVAVTDLLGKKFGAQAEVDALKAIRAQDTRVQAMLQTEAVAALLEKIAGIEAPANEYIINGYIAGPTLAEQQQTGGGYQTITYDALRGANGEFVSPKDQDADGKSEQITHRIGRPVPVAPAHEAPPTVSRGPKKGGA
ncbi:MAG: hypothetical protein H0U60_02480 [Blastocatellia bacterium]|nr:hypothetical protein [Blastocatellia bacterium]